MVLCVAASLVLLVDGVCKNRTCNAKPQCEHVVENASVLRMIFKASVACLVPVVEPLSVLELALLVLSHDLRGRIKVLVHFQSQPAACLSGASTHLIC